MALTGANLVGVLGSLTAQAGLLFNNQASFMTGGPVAAASLALGSTGAITDSGSIDAPTLASLGTIGGSVALTGSNTLATLGLRGRRHGDAR